MQAHTLLFAKAKSTEESGESDMHHFHHFLGFPKRFTYEMLAINMC